MVEFEGQESGEMGSKHRFSLSHKKKYYFIFDHIAMNHLFYHRFYHWFYGDIIFMRFLERLPESRLDANFESREWIIYEELVEVEVEGLQVFLHVLQIFY